MHEALVLIPKYLGDFTFFFRDISLENEIKPQCPSAQMRGDYDYSYVL